MDRIAGKRNLLFLILMFFGFVCTAQQGELKLLSHDGMPLKKAGVGQPFMLKFTTSYDGKQMQEPMLEGTQGLTVQRTGFQMHTINRSSQATYTYLARAKRPGTYVVGPVRYLHEGKERLSNTVTVQVAREQEIDKKAVNSTHKNAFAWLSVDKERVYVGEKIIYTIRFYFQDSSTEVEQLVRPDLDAFSPAEQKQAYTGKQKINDDEYRFFEWSWELYPKHVGTQTIDAHRLDFMQTRDTDDRFSRFNMFFGPQVERKRVYTNEATIEIKPLPPHPTPVVGIGSFKNFKARIEPPLSKEGEAMVLSLELEGEGNLDAVSFPALQNLPGCFRSYPSKQYIQSQNPTPTKIFEFIVQGMEPGNWEISCQECTYFDVASGQYKTLRTSPLSVTVLSSPQTQPVCNDEIDTVDHEVRISDQDELYPLMTSWGPVASERSLPFLWFWLLSIMPFAAAFGWYMYRVMQSRFFAYPRIPSRSTLFKNIDAALRHAERRGDPSQVYQLFVQLVAGLQKKPLSEVTQEQMLQLIDDNAWHAYVNRAAEYAFYAPENDVTFFVESFAWLDRLKKI